MSVTPKSGAEAGSYVGGVVSVASALTLTDVGVVIGIVTAVLTFLLNVFYQRRKDRREEEKHRLALELMRRGVLGVGEDE